MLTALKKITKHKCQNDVDKKCTVPQTMSQNLQKKFSQGIQYNIKIVIRGDTCCGKTSLFRRLQAKSMEKYVPTEEIQVANVQWSYKNADEVVKVEVWDVVDKGKKRSVPAELKFSEITAALDAEFLDVYKGTDGVIMVFDITKSWTFKYVQRELPKIPEDIPVLILGNFCDIGHHRSIQEDTVRQYVDSVQRPNGQAQIRYTESSMVNGFGLRYVYKFLALPFLQLRRKTLKRQMDRNAEEIDAALSELDAFEMTSLSNYRDFVEALTQKRREYADSLGVHLEPGESLPPKTPSVIFGLGHPINRYKPFAKTHLPISNGTTASNKINSTEKKNIPDKQMEIIEEFIPDEDRLDEHFFREESSIRNGTSQSPEQSDSENEGASNPLVAHYREDIEPEDHFISTSYYTVNGSNQTQSSDYGKHGSNPIQHGCGVENGVSDGKCIDFCAGDNRPMKGHNCAIGNADVTRDAAHHQELKSEQKRTLSLQSKSENPYPHGIKEGFSGGITGEAKCTSNVRGMKDNNTKGTVRLKKVKSDGKKHRKDLGQADDSKSKKHKKTKGEDRCRSKEKMKSQKPLRSGSFKDFEELFDF